MTTKFGKLVDGVTKLYNEIGYTVEYDKNEGLNISVTRNDINMNLYTKDKREFGVNTEPKLNFFYKKEPKDDYDVPKKDMSDVLP